MPAPAPFRAPYAPDDVALARDLFAAASLAPEREQRIDALGGDLIGAIRKQKSGIGGVEELLREYSLSTREGLALMVLAEALLRVPDGATADRLIEDKLGQGDFAHHETKSDALLVSASAWALGVTSRLIQPGETPEGVLGQLVKRMGLPTVRLATRQAMRVLGNHFVLGETIEDALKRATSKSGRIFRYSFDMLGEGARTAEDAQRYWKSYADSIAAIGAKAGNDKLPNRPGISVKLSALHPRYEAVSSERVLKELVPRVIELARLAKSHDLNFTIDAEEADRLELSLDVISAVFADDSLRGWDGFGLAIQAYQKRARDVIRWIDDLAAAYDSRMMVRLVKGAYWDTEVKRAQERGLAGYPVFTRKAMTDLSYAACAQELLKRRPRLFPQFATHNALTIATVLELAGDQQGFEFQRLHGMGEAAYEHLLETRPGVACRTYAPVGGYRDLLAYLVRRLLENGANSSFVSVAADASVPVAHLLARPQSWIGSPDRAANAKLPLPINLYGASRKNSSGVELGHAGSLERLSGDIESARAAINSSLSAASLISGVAVKGTQRPVPNPATSQIVGQVIEADASAVADAMRDAAAFAEKWNATPVSTRSAALERAADLMEQRLPALIALLQAEAGKTIDDSIAEVREAVDFLRYYASEAKKSFGAGELLPGPTGEENRLIHRGRGVFVCISPWNFPLAIFTGQVAAALAAGNAVIAKPAEQTPLIASVAVKIMHEAGVAKSALHLMLGDGRIGAALVAHAQVAGVAFTGSTEVARLINRALAAKDGPIVPLIAETGGVNAMIVDATALPEQVADDVVTSAFRSAGQRCSALRLLCVQEDVADKIIEMIVGATKELKLGDPADPATHVGPVIDREAKDKLDAYVARVRAEGKKVYALGEAPASGTFVAPQIVELKSARDLKEEVFGPVLHVARWSADRLDPTSKRGLYGLIEDIAATGYGLTMGLHTRINETMEIVEKLTPAGNLYINRNIIGAVVGTQPFGGSGLSGTGPKAGGPNYLKRFAHEQVVSINTAAAGGNASLLAMGE
ncbi:bifunctional proline dehydrogenase/L-glutamate gamma-semialdehyde dehydrogenase PutA [Terrarubrum flagellatum]|uniref:bifunctional proline dehydrogenase/L-glutamate gamma-semialdehyde dehydrogenase PutA n=1 Tax=Terrirubrum flagellatum TaxID=2895980 RepID=UPI003144DB9C